MKKGKRQCNKIKNLEKRLICLRDKYNYLTDQLEQSRFDSSNDEEELSYQQLIEERRIVEKYMLKLTRQLNLYEKIDNGHETGSLYTISPGNLIVISNEESRIRFRLVNEVVSSDDENQISINSPIGKGVVGKRVGDEFFVETPKGKTHYKIESIE